MRKIRSSFNTFFLFSFISVPIDYRQNATILNASFECNRNEICNFLIIIFFSKFLSFFRKYFFNLKKIDLRFRNLFLMWCNYIRPNWHQSSMLTCSRMSSLIRPPGEICWYQISPHFITLTAALGLWYTYEQVEDVFNTFLVSIKNLIPIFRNFSEKKLWKNILVFSPIFDYSNWYPA